MNEQKFKLNNEEMQILKNLIQMNQSIIFYPFGFMHNAPGKTIIAYYDFEKEKDFEEPFALYNGNEFVHVLNTFGNEDTEIEVKENEIVLHNKNNTFKYLKSDLELISSMFVQKRLEETPAIQQGEVICDFTLTQENMATLWKILSITKYNKLFFMNENKKLVVKLIDDIEGTQGQGRNYFKLKVNEKENIELNNLNSLKLYLQSDLFMKLLKNCEYWLRIYRFAKDEDEFVYFVRLTTLDEKLNYIIGLNELEENEE